MNSVKSFNNYSMFLFTYVICYNVSSWKTFFNTHQLNSEICCTLSTLIFFHDCTMRCYEFVAQLSLKNLSNILVNGLAGYHLMMSKQRFCTNLNSFLPKVNLICACVLCWFQLFLSDHLAEKRKRIAGRKVAYKDIDLKFLFELLGISELSIIFFYIALYCIVQTEEWGYLPFLKRKVYQTIIEIGWGPKGFSFSFLSVGLKSETKQFSGCILIFNIKLLYDTEYCAEWPTIKGELSDPIGPSK